MIEVNNLHKSFGNLKVLKGITEKVEESEVVCVIGPSGSGKSTFLRCLNLLETPTSGDIWINEEKITDPHVDINKIREEVDMVFQRFNLFPHMTALKNVALATIKVRELSKKNAYDRARDLLKKAGLEDKADAYPSSLSGGQQHRAAIARALAMRPKVMLFDEPTSALDPEMVGDCVLFMEVS